MLFDGDKLLDSSESYSIVIELSAILTPVWPVVFNYTLKNKGYFFFSIKYSFDLHNFVSAIFFGILDK
jgi:hypothetical protein